MDSSILYINELPSVERVKYVAQGLALLDAIIMPEWECRCFSFNCNWDGAGQEMMGSMRDGSGLSIFCTLRMQVLREKLCLVLHYLMCLNV